MQDLLSYLTYNEFDKQLRIGVFIMELYKQLVIELIHVQSFSPIFITYNPKLLVFETFIKSFTIRSTLQDKWILYSVTTNTPNIFCN